MAEDNRRLLEGAGKEPAPEDVATAKAATGAHAEVAEEAGGTLGPNEMPVLPVRGLVVFPGTMVPLTVGRPANLRLLEETLPEGKILALMTQLHAEEESPKPDGLFPVGVLVEVVRMVRQDENTMVVLVGVQSRWKADEFTQTEPYLKAVGEVLEDRLPAEMGDYWEAAVRNLRESASKLIGLNPSIPDEAKGAVESIEDPGVLTDFLASNLSLDLAEKQNLLEETDVAKRLEAVQRSVSNQLHIAELQAKLREDVETEFTDAQRRAYLREQVRAIQRELGEGDGTDEQAAELAEKIEKAGLPEEVKKEAMRELGRLENIPAASPEHSVILTYLETLCELPWDVLSEEEIDLKAAREVLDRDHFGLEKVKRRIVEFLAVRKLNPDGHGPILCFQGPPGVGKTSLGKSIADALGRGFSRIALGGIHDEAEIRGHRRTYIGAMPGRLIQELRRVGTRNPVFMLDEVDKIGADFRGDPSSALLEVLDPAQNHAFVDRYLDVPFDLSQVIFIATSNYLDNVPGPLRDRMEVLELPGYTENEKLEIAKGYLVGRQIRENGLDPEKVTWTDEALELVVEKYTREAGVRGLERQIGSVCRALAAEVATGREGEILITPEVVRETLGTEKFDRDEKLKRSQPGVVTGLAWTPVGGEVLHIEAIKFPGKGSVTLTGQLGEVMKESVQAAMSLVRQRAGELSIDPEDFEKFDVHVHVPAGAVPKDGPSAGGAMFTALASLYSGRRVSNEVAMTGEISLRGLVLPIGGLKEKALAALNAGVSKVLIPAKNAKDLEDVPKEALEALEIIPVETVDDVLREALLPDGEDSGERVADGTKSNGGGAAVDFDDAGLYGNGVAEKGFLKKRIMTPDITIDWSRYREHLVRYPDLGITLDISRMRFLPDYFDRMSDSCERAFAEMRELEGGEIANKEENRMVGHYWLRNEELAPNEEIKEIIRSGRSAAKEFADSVLAGEILTPGGERFTRLLVVGIGGSALGPQLVEDVLADGSGLKASFFDNTDPDGIDRTLGEIGDELGRTLTVVISKSGGTKETRNGMLEAERAYRAKGLDFGKHAVAVTGEGSALDEHAKGQGWIKRFPMADWVGGRTSVMSVVGLVPCALMGVDTEAFLDGAKAMDEETRKRPVKENMAMLLALMWYQAGNGTGAKDMVILPYKDRLLLLSKYLQQLVMESIGKKLDRDGNVVEQGIAVYGNKGSTDQHAYVQQLRDGLNNFFATFLEVRKGRSGESMDVDPGVTTGDYLQGFLRGTRSALGEEERESMTISVGELNAKSLGLLVAVFERAVSFYASLVNVNAYHQPGVEAGKKAAEAFLETLQKVKGHLAGSEGSVSAEGVASAIGEDVEVVYHCLNHLAANGGADVEIGEGAGEDRFSYVG